MEILAREQELNETKESIDRDQASSMVMHSRVLVESGWLVLDMVVIHSSSLVGHEQ
jgi:hypothetical protein